MVLCDACDAGWHTVPPPPPLPSRTNWTRLVPPSVLSGHVRLAHVLRRAAPAQDSQGLLVLRFLPPARGRAAARGGRGRGRGGGGRRAWGGEGARAPRGGRGGRCAGRQRGRGRRRQRGRGRRRHRGRGRGRRGAEEGGVAHRAGRAGALCRRRGALGPRARARAQGRPAGGGLLRRGEGPPPPPLPYCCPYPCPYCTLTPSLPRAARSPRRCPSTASKRALAVQRPERLRAACGVAGGARAAGGSASFVSLCSHPPPPLCWRARARRRAGVTGRRPTDSCGQSPR